MSQMQYKCAILYMACCVLEWLLVQLGLRIGWNLLTNLVEFFWNELALDVI
jgi:hypothetical protein